jgi:YidC/Oxa1 family membrane protein insertase
MLVMAINPLQLFNLSTHLYAFLPQLVSLLPLNNRFLWLDLGHPDPFYILPIVVVLTTYWQQKLMTPPSTDSQAEAMNRQMALMMPLMFGYFVMVSPSGLGLYWLISNVIGIGQYWLVGRSQTAPAKPGAPPALAGPAKKRLPEKK